ncbi:MAG TPA: class I SAM-dependent methyltransferase [Oleiagrimonas sp.]|nr:class I SAM-dependent methyltransferase [Oleiagrimonas sp.]
MRISILTLSLAAMALPLAAQAQTVSAPASSMHAAPAYVKAAINDPARKADQANDARRKMTAVMTFTGVKPGDTVVELAPGSGYWTRVFSRIVGTGGHVYQVWPEQMLKYSKKSLAKWKQLSATSHYANVGVQVEPAQTLSAPSKADVVFTSQNYHDYHNMGIDIAAFDKSVFDALKPGGVFIVIDHAAPAGSGTSDTDTLHRIDPATVKQEIEAAGFVFDGSSDALHNANDPHTATVFDKSIRGHTDQFIYRFRKPESGSSK